VSRRVWKVVETKAGEVRIAEAEGKRKEGEKGKKTIRKGAEEEKTKERKNDGGKEDSEGIGNLG